MATLVAPSAMANSSVGTDALPAAATRLDFLDALRGIAVLLVIVSHMLFRLSPAFATVTTEQFHLGHVGVIVFFLCSGYVIPLSLERQQSLAVFWVRRVCRLYPLYWVSIGLALACYWSGLATVAFDPTVPAVLDELKARPVITIGLSLTMLQGLFGLPHLLSPYWTLGIELVFYALISLAFEHRTRMQPIPIVLALITVACTINRVFPFPIGMMWAAEFIVYLAIMWTGTIISQAQRLPTRRMITLLIIAIMVIVSCTPYRLLGIHGIGSSALVSARLLGFAIFALGWLGRRKHFPEFMLGLGRMSYSLYLLHMLVMWFVPPIGNMLLTMVIWFALSVGCSALSYRWIELPAIAFGRRLTTAQRMTKELTSCATP